MNKINFSVIIPARNEEKCLKKCLDAVFKQNYKNFEIIVVDNGSTDKTAEIAKKVGATYIYEPVIGLPQARQAGFEAASGDYLTFIDADTTIPPDYLCVVDDFFRTHPDAASLTNRFGYFNGTPFLDAFIKIFFMIFELLYKLNLVKFIFGGNFTVSRKILKRSGGFDTSVKLFGEDTMITKKLAPFGKIYYLPNLFSSTSARRFKKWGFWKTFYTYTKYYLLFSFFKNLVFQTKKRFNFKMASYAVFVIVLTLFVIFATNPKSDVFGEVVSQVAHANHSKTVALTFDDGPNGQYTEEVLSLLDQEGVRGTFFLVGDNVKQYPQIARDIVLRGNQVGNHSYYHSWFLPIKRDESIDREIENTNEIIYQTTGVWPKYFRPPHGFRTPWMIKEVHRENMEVVEWNDMTGDYSRFYSVERISKNILKRVRPGSIIVLHDGLNLKHKANREKTIEALKIIIEELKKQGYSFTTLN